MNDNKKFIKIVIFSSLSILLLISPLFTTMSKGAEPPEKQPIQKTPLEKKAPPKLGSHHYSHAISFGGSGFGEGSFDQPVDIDVDSDNNIFVLDKGNNNIQKFDRNGIFLFQSEGEQWNGERLYIKKNQKWNRSFDGPSAIAIDKFDNVYIVEANKNLIWKFITEEDEAEYSSDTQQIELFDEEEVNKNEKIRKKLVIIIGSLGSVKGKFQNPTDIVIDEENNLYILDSGNYRIQKITTRGKIKEWGSYGSCRECFLNPTKLAYDPTGFGYIYVLDKQRKGYILHKTDTNGNFLETLDVFNNPRNPILNPTDIYIDKDGFLYILDKKSSTVYKFNTDGEFIQKISSPAQSQEATLKAPQAIIQDSDKRLLILDSKDNLIKIYDQN